MISLILEEFRRLFDYIDSMMKDFEHDALTEKVIGCCFEVHRSLGPGFNEKIYANALQLQLKMENFSFVAEKEFKVIFKGQFVGTFRCDLFIENN